MAVKHNEGSTHIVKTQCNFMAARVATVDIVIKCDTPHLDWAGVMGGMARIEMP